MYSHIYVSINMQAERSSYLIFYNRRRNVNDDILCISIYFVRAYVAKIYMGREIQLEINYSSEREFFQPYERKNMLKDCFINQYQLYRLYIYSFDIVIIYQRLIDVILFSEMHGSVVLTQRLQEVRIGLVQVIKTENLCTLALPWLVIYKRHKCLVSLPVQFYPRTSKTHSSNIVFYIGKQVCFEETSWTGNCVQGRLRQPILHRQFLLADAVDVMKLETLKKC